jgi:hypothetical protein
MSVQELSGFIQTIQSHSIRRNGKRLEVGLSGLEVESTHRSPGREDEVHGSLRDVEASGLQVRAEEEGRELNDSFRRRSGIHIAVTVRRGPGPGIPTESGGYIT